MTVWKYLQDSKIKKYHVDRYYWYDFLGKLYERIGRKIIKNNKSLIDNVCLNFDVISSEFVPKRYFKNKKIKFGAYKVNSPDYVYLFHCKNNDSFEKRAIVFEIKSGISPIQKRHIDFWEDLIKKPEKYISKCKEVFIFVLWIHGFDYHSTNIFYTIKRIKLDEIPQPDVHIGVDINEEK